MSWIIKASPRVSDLRTEEDPPEFRTMISVMDDGGYLYAVWPAESAPPSTTWFEYVGESEGYFYARQGDLPSDVADRLQQYNTHGEVLREGEVPGIEDGWDAGRVWFSHVKNKVTLDEWEYCREEE